MDGVRWTAGSAPADAAQRAADLLVELRSAEPDPAGRIAAVLGEHGETGVRLTPADLDELRAAAEPVAAVFAAPDTTTAAAALNALFARHAGPPRLTSHGGTAWHLHVDADDDGGWGEWFVTSSGLALAVLLAERQAPPGGVCAAPGCGAPFVAHGAGSPRRYCSARCATRVRVARHRAGG
ncbi:CGNR zinc finger domain-containing protein [Actinocatenispora thailandica]|nr:CGNR zinc finger domain-containing protein [Actinocatenispora thailandica]